MHFFLPCLFRLVNNMLYRATFVVVAVPTLVDGRVRSTLDSDTQKLRKAGHLLAALLLIADTLTVFIDKV
jgi:hypothetical protein